MNMSILHHARDQARREWLRAAGKLPGGQSRIDVGSHSSRVRSIGVQASTRIPHELTGDDSDVEGTAQDGDNETDGEGKTLISALKAELQKKNAFVQALQVSFCAPSSCTRFIFFCVHAVRPNPSLLGAHASHTWALVRHEYTAPCPNEHRWNQ